MISWVLSRLFSVETLKMAILKKDDIAFVQVLTSVEMGGLE